MSQMQFTPAITAIRGVIPGTFEVIKTSDRESFTCYYPPCGNAEHSGRGAVVEYRFSNGIFTATARIWEPVEHMAVTG
jgi:hypothetical protein